MEQRKYKTAYCQGRKNVPVLEEDRILMENTHEPIIRREQFEEIRRLNKENEKKLHDNYGKYDNISSKRNLFKKLVVCGDCGKIMTFCRDRSKSKAGQPQLYCHYRCDTYKFLREQGCTNKYIKKKN